MAKLNKPTTADYFGAATRITLGLILLWAFFDKLLGLGFATCNSKGVIERGCDAAWINGGSPTSGFLNFATHGSFADFYQSLAGNGFVDWLFMLGLLGIGLGLTFGIAMKLSGYLGALLMIMMWSSGLLPKNNPLFDDHIVYALVMLGLVYSNDRQVWGCGKQWKKLQVVKDNPWLE